MSAYSILKPVLFRCDPEKTHYGISELWRFTSSLPGSEFLTRSLRVEHPKLHVSVAGLNFPNPIGLAAGFDKEARYVNAMEQLGFGFIEVGTITPRAQPGNPKPRLFRLPQNRALINALGFNSRGATVVREQLQHLKHRVPLGINIGKNKDTPLDRATEDYLSAFDMLARFADYVTVNISSPNTPGLRSLQHGNALSQLLDAMRAARTKNTTAPKVPPLFVKISPDESPDQIEHLLDVVLSSQMDGIIVSNATIARPESLIGPHRAQAGGLSGEPIFEQSTNTLRHVFRKLRGRIPIIGVGGVSNATTAYKKIKAGANLLQLYTGLIYEGPSMVAQTLNGLVVLLEKDGIASIADAVGVEA